MNHLHHQRKIHKIAKLTLKASIAVILSYCFFIGLTTPTIAKSKDNTASPSATIAQATPSPAPSPTPSSESISEKVKEKIQELKSLPRIAAYTGEVQDKTDKTITLKSLTGLKQVSLDIDVTTIRQKDNTRQKIKPEDIAIGDYLIAMGTIDGTSAKILTTKRLVIVDKPKTSTKTAINGNLVEINSNNLKLETVSRGEWTVKITKETKFEKSASPPANAKTTDLELQHPIIVIGNIISDQSLQATKILLLN